ncbi:KilA-N domain-containing protein [Providencia rettgeri]|uniref:KilA-N domain-containing protein n=1 Tax=Providencia TaxID=586 RepID=UPI001121F173|nr:MULTISPECIES: KilA-N domain-containing protein [Providencia]EJD6670219.1 KilA-N domain-containing protein [Providencia rettgeri]ELR5146841.1 KilA-N domain-containing protein [Providencia rettgeri]ELT5686052.1 KilA-N domain-containing protein [Providencia rettgeri]EMC8778315.1 KilA-N domain-containing protein [Providencia rettgeri]MBN6351000.1 KilA-N domain-containing protein [Providencia rettgeri]
MQYPRVSVNGVSVRVDNEGRYSLNDLHASAVINGEARENQNPSQFLRSKQVKAFVDKLSAMQNCTAVKVINGGLNHGVWALELVVIRYAAWLKPEFEILVYNTFKDAARKGLDVMARLNKLDHIINTETKNVSGCARTMANWGSGGRKQLLLTARERIVSEAQIYLPGIDDY